jgi:uncharacterized protein involved in exopolysaccharide biosynthesis
MDQAPDTNKPPSASYRGTFRRHRKLFYMPVILGALAALFSLFGGAKSYKSTASLWIDTPPPAASSLASASTVTYPPAASEQAALSELLTTRSFVSSVAEHSLLGKSLGSADSIRKNAATLLGAGQIVPTVAGNQILQISTSASSPAVAQSVLGAVVAELRNYTGRATTQHDQAAIAYDRAQVKGADKAVATARTNVTEYQARHPGASQTDPNYVSLIAAENNAMTQLAQANTALGEITGTGNGDAWAIQVIDPPSQGTSAVLRKRKMIEIVLAGLLGGALVSFLAVVALTPAKKESWEDELPIGGPLAPVAPRDPFREGSPTAPAPEWSTPATTAIEAPRLSLGDRRFQFQTPSAPTEEQ